MIYNIFVTPIENIIEVIFYMFHKVLWDQPGVSIMFVSLAVNLLILPLYKRADEMQERERDKVKSMEKWNKHIRKTFKGDERYMIQTAYYRIEGYKPFYAITGSLSLLFQIPFFIAAYHFLSKLTMLSGMSFLMIPDLASPDGLIKIGALSINVMPILMTLINIISGMIYTKGFKLKDKLQLYGMALIFLVVLYKSPSGLVLYWTCNNLFSLGKNIFFKYVKDQKLGAAILSAVTVIAFFVAMILTHRITMRRQYLIFGALTIISFMPLVFYVLNKLKISVGDRVLKAFAVSKDKSKLFTQNFLFGAIFLTVFLGFLIPSGLIVVSPVEFGSLTDRSPFELIVYTVCTYAGTFLVWISIFYFISRDKLRAVFSYAVWIASGVALVNYYAFFGDFGIMTYNLMFEQFVGVGDKQKIINLLILIPVVVGLYFLIRKLPIVVRSIYQILIVMMVILGIVNLVNIQKNLVEENYYETKSQEEIQATIPLSKNGKNVVIIMMDRAIGAYIPYIFNERPELATKYSDFVYYPNTVSYGSRTNYGSPAIYGGYEYTPLEINKRTEETIIDKHNEALKVLPKLFTDIGYEAYVCDPPLAGYMEIPDISIYDDMDHVNGYITTGYYGEYIKLRSSANQKRNMYFYSLFRTVPVVFQNSLYDNGQYLGKGDGYTRTPYCAQAYGFMSNLSKYTYVDENEGDTLFEISNLLTHRPTYLETQGYTLDRTLNVELDYSALKDRYTVNGETLRMEEDMQVQHYHVNMATYILLGDWIDWLKKEGIYDNTRIIIVSDHGYELWQLDSTIYSDELDMMYYNPILFVKDFADSDELEPEEYTYLGDTKIKTTDKFMTVGEVPFMAMKGIIDHPVNPYTGKEMVSDLDKGIYPIITTSQHNHEDNYEGNIMNTTDGQWFEIRGHATDKDSWKLVEP